MKTKFHFTKIILCVLLGAFASVTLLGGCHPFRHERKDWSRDTASIEKHARDRLDKILKKVDATDEQRAKAYAIRDKVMPSIVAFAKERQPIVTEALNLWGQPTLDANKLNALVDKRSDQMKALAHELVYATAEFHAILTQEQRKKLQDIVEEHCE